MPLLLSRLGSVTGTEHLPQQGPCIIAANHVTYIEPAVISSLVVVRRNEKVYSVTKLPVWKAFRKIGLADWLGMVPVDRQNPDQCLTLCARLLERGAPVLIFPEGTRNTSSELLRGKTGVARLALWTGAPVLPIGYRGPGGKTTGEAIWNFLFRAKDIHVRIGAPLQFPKTAASSINHDLLVATTDSIMRAIAPLCQKQYHD